MTTPNAPAAKPKRRWLRYLFAVAAAAVVGVVVGVTLFSSLLPQHGSVYQGFWTEISNRMLGGQYKVSMYCPLRGNMAGAYVLARDEAAARTELAWEMPACELTRVTIHNKGESWFGQWYYGVFKCPANFHRRTVYLSAPALQQAITLARRHLRGCRPEYADQIACGLLDGGCDKGFVDYRPRRQFSLSRLR